MRNATRPEATAPSPTSNYLVWNIHNKSNMNTYEDITDEKKPTVVSSFTNKWDESTV